MQSPYRRPILSATAGLVLLTILSLPAMKNISIADRTTLSLGGEFRERIEAGDNTELGRAAAGGNSTLLQYGTDSAELESNDLWPDSMTIASWGLHAGGQQTARP